MKSEKKRLNTPILFIVFNRPNTTIRVWKVISKIQPKYLYIAADGPRPNYPDDIEKCQKVRNIFKKIDWTCNIHTLFRNKNLGCKLAVSSALNWFFENVEEGIILEDDCLPDISFFYFCENLLKKYRKNNQVMHISGDNFQNGISRSEGSYYFSQYSHVWGWATWRRAWRKYDVTMRDWPKYKNSSEFLNIFNSYLEKLYWKIILDRVYNGQIDTWDYQWLYTIFKERGVCINPNKNLVLNIGFNQEATHTKKANFNLNYKLDHLKFPITYLNYIEINYEADEFVRKKHFRINIPMIVYQYIRKIIS